MGAARYSTPFCQTSNLLDLAPSKVSASTARGEIAPISPDLDLNGVQIRSITDGEALQSFGLSGRMPRIDEDFALRRNEGWVRGITALPLVRILIEAVRMSR